MKILRFLFLIILLAQQLLAQVNKNTLNFKSTRININPFKYRLDSIIGPKSDEIGELAYKDIYQYNEDGKVASYIDYNLNDKTWENNEKVDYSYNDGLLKSELTYTWNNAEEKWNQIYKTEYFYSSESKIVKKIYFDFNEAISIWDSSSVENREYFNSNRIEKSTTYIYSKSEGFTENNILYKYYNSYGLIDSLIRFSFIENKLSVYYKENNGYDKNGYLIKKITWDKDNNGPIQITSIEDVTYDINKNPSFAIQKPLTGDYLRLEYAYDLRGNYLNTSLPFFPDDTEEYEFYRNGLITEVRGYLKNESGIYEYINEGGTIYYSGFTTTAIYSKTINENITIYPTPSSDVVNVKFNQTIESIKSYNIIGIKGELIKTGIFENGNYSIYLENIPSGLYFCELIVSDKKYYQKIIKN